MLPTPPTGAPFNRRRLFLSACGALFVFGVVLVLLGTLFGMPQMRARLQLTDMVRQGNLQTLLLFGVFLATVVAGPLIDRFGNKLVLAVSALLATVALIGFAAGHGYSAAQSLRLCPWLGRWRAEHGRQRPHLLDCLKTIAARS